MDLFSAFFHLDAVAQALLILSLVIASGLALGSIRILGISLGIAGVLFSGLFFAHLGAGLDPGMMLFVRDFGLTLFVYSVGLQVGPSFVASFYRQGLKMNLLAASIVLLGVAMTLLVVFLGGIEIPVAVGLFCGATTNTPSLAAAQQALASLSDISKETLKMPGLGYAVAYPFGVIGVILSLVAMKSLFQIMPEQEAREFLEQQQKDSSTPIARNLTVQNPNLNGMALQDIPSLKDSDAVVTRVLQEGRVSVATPATVLKTGDIIRVVFQPDRLEALRVLIGPESDKDLEAISVNLISRKIIVTRQESIGKTVGEIQHLHGVAVARINRPDVEFVPSSTLKLQYGDQLVIVGQTQSLAQVEKALGNSLEQLNHPQILPIFIGIALGVILGHWPISLPWISTPVKLGAAGGPLLVAIFLSRVGNFGAMNWQLPRSSNLVLREIGIVLFLACVGLNSGDIFLRVLLQGDGLYWMGLAAGITLLPLFVAGFIGRKVLRMNFMSLCGLLSGSMTDPPALAFANSITASNAPSMAYATVYPLVILLRILSAQLLVVFLS